MLVFIEITLNIFVLAGAIVSAALIGFIPRSARISKAQRTIDRLEKEMLSNHAEILTLQKELTLQANQSSRTPIVPIRENGAEPKKEASPDPLVRKKISSGGSATNP
jgi:hypothetical protein